MTRQQLEDIQVRWLRFWGEVKQEVSPELEAILRNAYMAGYLDGNDWTLASIQQSVSEK